MIALLSMDGIQVCESTGAAGACLIQVPMAFATTVLLWGLIRYPEAYADAGELDNMLASVKWPLDYFIKAHNAPDQVSEWKEVDRRGWYIG